MPTARRRKTKKNAKTTPTPMPPVRLPEGYQGPAYRLADGRALFVARRGARSRNWGAAFWLANGTTRMFSSALLPIVTTKREAQANLIKYAAEKGLQRVQTRT